MKTFTRIHLYAWLGLMFLSLTGYAAITVTPGGGGGSGGSGGVLTNNTVAAVIANFYTNDTPHWIEGEARLGTSTAGRIQAAVTNSNNTLFFHYQNEVATAGALSNTISFKVPPGGWWKFIGLTTTATDGQQQLLYMATNGSVTYATSAGNAATVTDGATQSGLAAGSYAINGSSVTNIGQCWLVFSNGNSLSFSNNVLAAASNAAWGDVIKLSAGRFHIGSNSLPLNPGVNIVGEGAASKIIGYGFGPAILLGISNIVDSVYVDYDPVLLQNLIIETDDTIIFQPFGVPSAVAGAFSGKLGYSANLVTNTILRNVIGHGQSDCLFLHTNSVHLTVQDSLFFADWDFYYEESLASETRFDNVTVFWLKPSLTNSGGDYFSTQNAIVNATGNNSNKMVFSNCRFESKTTAVLRIQSVGNTNTYLNNCVIDMPITNGGSPFVFVPSEIKSGNAWINGSNYIFGLQNYTANTTLTGASTNLTPQYLADYSVQSEGSFYTNTTSRRADITLSLVGTYDTLPGWLGFQVCVVDASITNYFFSSVFYDSTSLSTDINITASFPLNPSARFYWERADGSVSDATYGEKVKSNPPNAGAKGSHIIYK